MEAAINEICGQIFRGRPFSGGVGKNEGNIELAQQFEKIRDQKTHVPNFYAITQGPIALYFQPGARVFSFESCRRPRSAAFFVVFGSN